MHAAPLTCMVNVMLPPATVQSSVTSGPGPNPIFAAPAEDREAAATTTAASREAVEGILDGRTRGGG